VNPDVGGPSEPRQRRPGAAWRWRRRSVLRTDCPVLLASGSRGETRCARCASFARTVAASQTTMRAARADPDAALRGAADSAAPRPACAAAARSGRPARPARSARSAWLRPAGARSENSAFGAREADGDGALERRNAAGKGAGRPLPACLCAAEKRSSAGRRAQRASSSDSPRLSERSSRSERSEFRGAAATASIAGHPRAAGASTGTPAAGGPRLCPRQPDARCAWRNVWWSH